jgi:BlaI family penicillinase repressor
VADQRSISDAEWHVMHVIWERQPVAAQDVIAALAASVGWSPATIRTMLHRLVKKHVLAYEQAGNRYFYRSRLRRAECLKQAARSFVERVFGGDAAPLLVQMVRSTRLSPAEIAELKQLLEEQETA